jgi:spore cortex formation protein SpoVR/YcgB (stage V sporulation)
MNRIDQMRDIHNRSLNLFIKKNKDYGDAFARYGIIGVLIRIQDKIQRCISITSNGVNLVEDESLIDTLMDLHNYSAMALMFDNTHDMTD